MVIFCEKSYRKQVRRLTYLNKNIDYDINRLNPCALIIIFKEKENEEYIYSNSRDFAVSNHNR